MQADQLPEELSSTTGEQTRNNSIGDPIAASAADTATEPAGESRVLFLLERLSHLGLADSALRIGTHMLSIAAVLLVVWLMREFYLHTQTNNVPRQAVLAAALPTSTPTTAPPELPPLVSTGDIYLSGIPRLIMVHTTIPTRPRTEVIPYEVQKGDTVFGIAEK